MPQALSVSRSYAVLGNLVQTGFDCVAVTVGGVRLVLKTINSKETALMAQGSPHRKKETRLAYATFMLDGVNVLDSRPGNLAALEAFYASMPGIVVSRLSEALDDLQERSYAAMGMLLGYSFSHASRSLWRVYGHCLNSVEATGVVGTQYLGLNPTQEQWYLLNKGMDEEAHESNEMRRAMFVASAYNPKGVEKSSARMESQEKNRQEERGALVRFGSLANRELILGIVKAPDAESWAPKLVTRKDIERELEKMARGEKDKHDLFVEEYYRRKAEEAAAQAAREDEERRVKYQRFNPDSVFQGQAAVSQEEMDSAMRGDIDIRDLVAGRPRFGDVSKGKVRGHRVIR